jgi:L,D-transpeptidase ErfK/SrfK
VQSHGEWWAGYGLAHPSFAKEGLSVLTMKSRRSRARGSPLLWAAGIAILIAIVLGVWHHLAGGNSRESTASGLDAPALEERIHTLTEENDGLEGRLKKLVPKEPHILVNRTLNRIYVRKGEEVLLEAVCSTGSNTELIAPDSTRRWFFSTPGGVFKVRSRMKRPIWVRPDWSFVEEGEPIPAPNAPERFETGVLGDYGLYFGDGYLIHGTLFQRFLGQPVTHGCIRVGDEDLEKIWELTRVGTPIYIF